MMNYPGTDLCYWEIKKNGTILIRSKKNNAVLFTIPKGRSELITKREIQEYPIFAQELEKSGKAKKNREVYGCNIDLILKFPNFFNTPEYK